MVCITGWMRVPHQGPPGASAQLRRKPPWTVGQTHLGRGDGNTGPHPGITTDLLAMLCVLEMRVFHCNVGLQRDHGQLQGGSKESISRLIVRKDGKTIHAKVGCRQSTCLSSEGSQVSQTKMQSRRKPNET